MSVSIHGSLTTQSKVMAPNGCDNRNHPIFHSILWLYVCVFMCVHLSFSACASENWQIDIFQYVLFHSSQTHNTISNVSQASQHCYSSHLYYDPFYPNHMRHRSNSNDTCLSNCHSHSWRSLTDTSRLPLHCSPLDSYHHASWTSHHM